MKKILIITGVISVLVLILFGMLFVGGFGSFAQLLGEKSQEISVDEKTRFIGMWESGDEGKITFLTDGTYSTDDDEGSFMIKSEKLILTRYYFGTKEEYNYSFSDDGEKLTLTNSDSYVVFIKK